MLDPAHWQEEEKIRHVTTDKIAIKAHRNAFSPRMLFGLLEDLPKKPREKLDSVMIDLLTDLEASHEIVWALHLHRPLGRETPACLDGPDAEMLTHIAWRGRSSPGKKPHMLHLDISDLRKPLSVIMAPRPAKHLAKGSAAWMELRRAERKALEKFWKPTLEITGNALQETDLTKDEIDSHLAVISCTQSPVYADLVQAEELEHLQQKDPIKALASTTDFTPSFASGTLKDLEHRPKVEKTETKTKSRGTPVETSDAPTD
jgi:hypothetical protein